jgi:hypothetical protein
MEPTVPDVRSIAACTVMAPSGFVTSETLPVPPRSVRGGEEDGARVRASIPFASTCREACRRGTTVMDPSTSRVAASSAACARTASSGMVPCASACSATGVAQGHDGTSERTCSGVAAATSTVAST